MENGQKIMDLQRKTGFLGFLIGIKTLQNLYNDIHCTNQVPYIATYRLSQDHIELFFSCVRSFGRNNNNLPALQFQTAFKKLLLRNEVKAVNTANCMIQDLIPMIDYTSKSSIEIINSSTDEDFTYRDIIPIDEDLQKKEARQDVLQIHNHSSNAYSEYADKIITYMAG